MPRQSKILYLEDDPYLSRMFVDALLDAGFAVSYCNHPPKNVVNLVVIEQPDLILMDIIMPEMDGFTATALLQADARTKHVPVFGMSNLGQPEDMAKALEVGMWDYWVTAEHTPQQVIRKIQSILNGEPRKQRPAQPRT